MEKLLFGLTPSEFWALNYLVFLAQKQGSLQVILPAPGESPELEKVFSRRHLRRLLKSLRKNFILTKVIFPCRRGRSLMVFLPERLLGDMGVLKWPSTVERKDTQVPKQGSMGAPMSPNSGLRTCMSPVSEVITALLPDLGPGKLKLKEVIEKILELKQGDLKVELKGLGPRTLFEMERALGQVVKVRPRGEKLSIGARVFAMVRFLQSGGVIEKPQAWIDNVARAAERELWTDANAVSQRSSAFSLKVGRSPFVRDAGD